MPRTIPSETDFQRESYGVSRRIGKERFGLRPEAASHGWKVTGGRKWEKTGVSQESLPTQFFWIDKEHFGFPPRTRWFFFHRGRCGSTNGNPSRPGDANRTCGERKTMDG